MKRVFIVHGWDGSPQEGWFPWLKSALEKQGFKVEVPAMPEAHEPKMELWIPHLASIVGKPDADTYFVGHSIGCQAIIRYFETLPKEAKIGGAVFVAGWYDLRNLETEDEKRIAGPWVTKSRDDAKIKSILGGKAVALFSDNDKWVVPENQTSWKEKAGAHIVVLSGRGHFSGSDGVIELPEALDAILKIASAPVISIDDFAKIQIKMGKILTAERIEGSDKLLKLSIDLGEGSPRTICSGVAQFYTPEQVIGKMVPVITNLAPRKMKGIESNGMVLFGINEVNGGHAPIMLNPDRELPPGSAVS